MPAQGLHGRPVEPRMKSMITFPPNLKLTPIVMIEVHGRFHLTTWQIPKPAENYGDLPMYMTVQARPPSSWGSAADRARLMAIWLLPTPAGPTNSVMAPAGMPTRSAASRSCMISDGGQGVLTGAGWLAERLSTRLAGCVEGLGVEGWGCHVQGRCRKRKIDYRRRARRRIVATEVRTVAGHLRATRLAGCVNA